MPRYTMLEFFDDRTIQEIIVPAGCLFHNVFGNHQGSGPLLLVCKHAKPMLDETIKLRIHIQRIQAGDTIKADGDVFIVRHGYGYLFVELTKVIEPIIELVRSIPSTTV